jgi:putative polyhydroxyalkanoate system protein
MAIRFQSPTIRLDKVRVKSSMATIEINKAFTMPRDKLREQLDGLAEQLGQELQLNCEWLTDDCLKFSRSGANGQVNIGDDEIDLTITLGIIMEFFRGKIEREILEFIDQHIY